MNILENIKELNDELLIVVDNIEHAIENKDWNAIANAYALITGRKIEVPSDDKIVDSQFKELLERVNKLENNTTTTKSNKTSKTGRKKATAKQEEKINRFEQMVDILPEVDKEDGFDKINDNIKPTSRNRPKFSQKQVTCRECGKTNEVHPMFAKENYICDRCLNRRNG
jgi:hypothetical protein